MKIYIQKPLIHGAGIVKIWVIEEIGDNRYSISFDSESKLLTQSLIIDTSAEEPVPFLELPSEFFNELVKAIVQHASDNNIKAESETLLQGKLSATEKHLEDLRTYFPKVLNKIVRD